MTKSLHEQINDNITGRLALLTEGESELLSKYAGLEGDYLEIGCLWGGTAILAALSKLENDIDGQVYTIDFMQGGFWDNGDPLAEYEIPTLEKVKGNLEKFGVGKRVSVIVNNSNPLPLPKGVKPTVVMIDGDHSYEGCMVDWMNVRATNPDYVLIHDYDKNHPGVQKAVDYIRGNASDYELIEQEHSLVVFKRVKRKDPTVSVIVPTYNRREMLDRALASITDQSFRDYEIIVVNDAGVDVWDIVKQYPKATLINHAENKYLAAARNTGVRQAKGKYITFLDDDDVLMEHHLKTQVEWIEKGYSLIYTDVYWWIEEQHLVEHISIDYTKERLYSSCLFPVMAAMVRRELFALEMFDEDLKSHEDYDLWLRLSNYVDFKHVPVFTAAYSKREDSDQMSNLPGHIATRDYVRSKNKTPVVKDLVLAMQDGAQCYILQDFTGNICGESVSFKKGQSVTMPKESAIDYTRAGFVKIYVKVIAADD